MKKLVRSLALLLALLMCIFMLASCDEEEESKESPNKKTESNEINEETVIDKSELQSNPLEFNGKYTAVENFYICAESQGYRYTYEFNMVESTKLCKILNNANWFSGELPTEAAGEYYGHIFTDGKNGGKNLTAGFYYREGVFHSYQIGGFAVLTEVETKDFNKILDIAAKREPIKEMVAAKPVIYLYPEADTVCSVEVNIDGELTCTYPNYGVDGWQNFTAKSDGTLNFPDGREYYCLYWEGIEKDFAHDFSQGFCVKGSESAEFLNSALLQLGLTPREANEFIIYWLPKLEANEYNLLSFQFENYTNSAPLEITPTPDSVLRVFLAMKQLDEYVEIAPQELPAFERKGFTVVEWGGTWVE